jgi:DNA-binding response OmpR family regulator
LGPAKRDIGAILVVDDELEIRNVLAHTLMDEGYRVIQASDGRAALEQMERSLPALVVLDLLMPTMGGLEVLDGMNRRAGTLSEVPVIVLSEAHARLPRGVANVVAQMRKPVNLDLLLQRAETVLSQDPRRAP